ncbi:phosphate/phosphite/phosphonate ABC transporter substrate-binding protein [Oceanicoccus sp. KOV_DT_Chl]|uniref:phosphate/phosphite/phosphonate ABC transporter substrate-binding protein n=1 Tax=Oceanicoccus sp. KOV_DT_Chl TaxID=1904639 RepID=UPI000C7B2F67|nr:PhnD/SsuA/transferrin family substrate-binding protein [Oceanicoccus sp. KOV_DT_Chl]
MPLTVRCKLLLLFILLHAASAQSQQQAEPPECMQVIRLTLGAIPWTSASLTHLWSKKISRHLDDTSCIELSFKSARNFEQFIEAAIVGDFDIAHVPAHIASYLILHHGFTAIAQGEWDGDTLFVTRLDSTIESIDDSAKAIIAVPDPLALVTLFAKQFYASQPSAIPRYLEFSNHDAVLHALLEGQVDSGVILAPIYNGYSRVIKGKLRILQRVKTNTQGYLIARENIDPLSATAVIDSLSSFDIGTDLLWAKWLPISSNQVAQLHVHYAEYVKIINSKFGH